jgi:hypothetical protein
MKTCTLCQSSLPLERFSADQRNRTDGRQMRCKSCKAKEMRIARRTKPEVYAKINRRAHLKRAFKMTEQDYIERFLEQGGVCFTCGRQPNSRYGILHIDHSHTCCPGGANAITCGRCVRALLCDQCNAALGQTREDPRLLERLAEYVRWFSG